MRRPLSGRKLCRTPAPPLVLLVLLVALLLPAGVAVASDGVPLYPPRSGSAYNACSMTNADLCGPMLAFELWPMDPPAGSATHSLSASAVRGASEAHNPTVYGWNTNNGANWPLGKRVPGWDADMLQVDPTVAIRGNTVFVVWSQRSDVNDDSDLWIWKGSQAGIAAPGYPKLLVQGPANTNQGQPDLGTVTLAGSRVLWLAWADDRSAGGATTQIYVLPVSADSDRDGTLDIDEAGYAPTTAGLRMDPTGDPVQGQHDPSVGPKGVFWLDDRDAAGSGESAIWRGQPSLNDAAAGLFSAVPADSVKLNVRATAAGAAWLGPGLAGGPFQPWGKNIGKGARILAFLGDPGEFDATGSAYAFTGRHGGTTDLDRDIFFWSSRLRQLIPVCDSSAAGGAYDHRMTQAMPAISTAPGGYRIVWSDARGHYANATDTPEDNLAYRLYTARVPTVTLKVSTKRFGLGKSVTLSTAVRPRFAGYSVVFQKGTRHTFTSAYGSHEWFDHWKPLKGRTLSAKSSASYAWTPSAKGTYWLRAWFKGGRKYVDIASARRKVPHIPMSSAIVKVVVH